MLQLHRVKKQLPLVPHRFLQDRWLRVEGAALGRAKQLWALEHGVGPGSEGYSGTEKKTMFCVFMYLCIQQVVPLDYVTRVSRKMMLYK